MIAGIDAEDPRVISIHAPVKGATRRKAFQVAQGVISIHAPVKGATYCKVILCAVFHYFNPRTREGCDVASAKKVLTHNMISIHAPVKGATRG